MSFFKKASELEEKKAISVLIYGQPGAGKSTLGASAPGPVVVFDFDGGIRRVNMAHRAEIITVEINEWSEVGQTLADQEMATFNTIVIDTAGKMLSFMDKDIIAKSRDKNPIRSLTLNEYGIRKSMFNSFIQQILSMGKNLIFIAHEREEKDGDVKKIRPEIGGSSAGDLIKELDLVGYLQLIGNERVISFTPCERFYAKNACNLPPAFKVPIILDTNGNMVKDSKGRVIRNTFLSDVVNTYTMSQGERTKRLVHYNELKDEVELRVADVNNSESATKAKKDIDEMEEVFDIRLYANQKLYEKCISLHLKWSHSENAYISVDKKGDKGE